MVRVNAGFTIEDGVYSNFWILNPQIAIRVPYAKLYERDKSEEKEKSSREMWTVFFMCDPDESKNTFYSLPLDQRKDALQQRLAADVDFEDDLFRQCVESYPFDCMSAVERTLKEEIDSMRKRAAYIASYDYTGQSVMNNKNFDLMRAQTAKIYDVYEEIQAKFSKEKQVTRTVGGGKVSRGQEPGKW